MESKRITAIVRLASPDKIAQTVSCFLRIVRISLSWVRKILEITNSIVIHMPKNFHLDDICYKVWNDHGRPQGGGAYRTFAHPLEIGTKKRKFLENLKLAA